MSSKQSPKKEKTKKPPINILELLFTLLNIGTQEPDWQ